MRSQKAATFLSALLLFSMSCSLFGSLPSTSQPVKSPSSQDGAEPKMAEAGYEPVKINLPALGKVNFSPDPTNTVTAEFPADGSDVSMQLTDLTGLTWKLDVPGVALGWPVTLKMTVLKDVKSDDLPGAYKGGIQFEPDGLQFRTPATLTVSGFTGTIVLLSGAQDGSAMNLAVPGPEKNSAEIGHFSAVVAGDPAGFKEQQSLDGLVNKVAQQEKDINSAILQFLKEHQKDLKVPVPPSVSVECMDGQNSQANSQQVDKFLQDAMQPEQTLIIDLLGVLKNKQLLGMEGGSINSSLLPQLMARLEKKVNLLMKTYPGIPEKLIPVTQFAIAVGKQNALLGMESAPNFLGDLGDWIAKSIDQIIKDIVEKHDYRKSNAVLTVAKWVQLLGSDSKTAQLDTLLKRLSGALRFNLQVTSKYSTMDSIWDTTSEFPMRMNQDPPFGQWQGSGTGNIAYTFTKNGNVSATTQAFPINALITRFDVCKGEAEISLDRFFGDSETINVEGQEVTGTYTKSAWEFIYAKYKSDKGYVFPVTIHNLDATAVNEPVEGQTNCSNRCSVKLDIKLIHTPQYIK